jgi:uncharacterized lipoprotein YmbA
MLLAGCALGAGACGLLSPRQDPTRLYVLATIEELEPERAAAEHGAHSLGVGPLEFPEYLRNELISRDDVTAVVPYPYERWAEPLDKAVERVLSGNLAFLSGARTVAFPWYGKDAPETSVQVRFERLELEQRERAIVIATWSLRDSNGGALVERRSQIARDLPDATGTAASLELSRALAALSEEIAEAWRAVPAPDGG